MSFLFSHFVFLILWLDFTWLHFSDVVENELHSEDKHLNPWTLKYPILYMNIVPSIPNLTHSYITRLVPGFPTLPDFVLLSDNLIGACEFHKCFSDLYKIWIIRWSSNWLWAVCRQPVWGDTEHNNHSVDQFLRAIQSLDYYSRHTLVPVWTSAPLHQMAVVERLVRLGLHAVIDCSRLINQDGDSDGPICHCAGVKLTDGLWSSAAWKGTLCYLHLFSLCLFHNTISAALQQNVLHSGSMGL